MPIADFRYLSIGVPTGQVGDTLNVGVSGTGFSPSGGTLYFQKVGRWVFFTLEITGNSAASGFVQVAMPYTAAHAVAFAGREDNVTGLGLVGQMGAGSANMTIVRASDNGMPGSTPGGGSNTNVHIIVSGLFEATG